MVKRRTMKRSMKRTKGRKTRKTPRAGARARMTGTQPTRRSARLAAKKRLSMKGLLDEIGSIEKKTVSTARKTTKTAKKTAKKLKTMTVNELADVLSAFKL